MSLSSSTLVAIQKAGSAVFTADEMLKLAAKNLADRVNASMTTNPDNLDNDALIESWKTVARLSQAMAGIEAEIKRVFQSASELTSVAQPSVAATPKRTAKVEVVAPSVKVKASKKATGTNAATPIPAAIDLTPTEVVIKSKKKTTKPQASAAVTPTTAKAKKSSPIAPVAAAPTKVEVKSKTKASASKEKVISAKPGKGKTQPGALIGNPAKLLLQLERLLNTNDFVEINQTAIAKDTGIAMGSMTAAIKKLVDLGRISAGPAGSYKLTAPALAEVAPEAVAS